MRQVEKWTLMAFLALACHAVLVKGLIPGYDSLSRRSDSPVTTTAVCSPNFAWMNNSEGQSPCLAVGYVLASCADDNMWLVPALQPNGHYDQPNASTSTVNGCFCSWSSYNLYSACAVCQGDNPLTWGVWTAQCPTNDSSSYFPSGYTLSNDSSIPYWAATNPADWHDAVFNASQAQVFAGQNHSDLMPGTASTSSSTSKAGTVTGVVIDVVLAVGIVGVVAFGIYMWRTRPLKKSV